MSSSDGPPRSKRLKLAAAAVATSHQADDDASQEPHSDSEDDTRVVDDRPCVTRSFEFGRGMAESVTVRIPEVASDSLGGFLWPSAQLLAEYMQRHMRQELQGKTVLELGAGRCLCGIHLALMGCRRVILTDAAPSFLADARAIVSLNGPVAKSRAEVRRLAWAEFTPDTIDLKGHIDLVIGADVLYESADFEDVFATVAFFGVPFLTAYQHRGEGKRRFHHLCRKWGMRMRTIPFDETQGALEQPDDDDDDDDEDEDGERHPRLKPDASEDSTDIVDSRNNKRGASSLPASHADLELLMFTCESRVA